MSNTIASPDEILEFWFSDAVRSLWFASTPAFDRQLAERFLPTFDAAVRGELDRWQDTPSGALALVIVLDQFPLNMFRSQPESFATESMARAVAHQAILRGYDVSYSNEEKGFLYLPFMHSESLADQNRSVALYRQAGLDASLPWALHHRNIIRRFGRFPHRNAILGRGSTRDEATYLSSQEAFHG
jgi:uncharacterized protein (DUF924 family)